jgi:hypothetical protein
MNDAFRRYGYSVTRFKAAVFAGCVLALGTAVISAVGISTDKGWHQVGLAGTLKLFLMLLLIPFFFGALVALLSILSVRVGNGMVQQIAFGKFILCKRQIADFISSGTSAIGPILRFRDGNIYLIAMYLRELQRLTSDLRVQSANSSSDADDHP